MPWATSSVRWTPHAGQRKAVKFLLEHAAAALFASPGTGKTSSVLAAFKILKKRGLAEKMLVVAPLRPATMVWPAEVRKWTDFRDFRVEVLHGKDKEKALRREADIYIINYEGLAWLFDIAVTASATGKSKSVAINAARFRELGFDTLVADELSRLKHGNSITFKTLKPALQFFNRRWGLTGSPASNGLQDLWGQMYVIDQGRSLGQYITHYRNEFFHPHPSGFGWQINKGVENDIYKRVAPVVLRLAAEDYIDMPRLIMRRTMFDLPPDIRKIYDEVEDDLITKLESGLVVASNAAAASSKCRQIVSGGVYLENEDGQVDEKRWQNLHNLKTDLLADLVDELQGEPVLVAYGFYHDLDRLLLRFGKNTPYIGGGVSPKRALEIERAWNAGEIPLLLGHPASIGHGLNLQGAGAQVCWYSLTFDLEVFEQLNGRVHRQGQKAKHVFVHHLMARETIDEVMWWALQNKAKGQNALLDALKQRRRK